MTEREQRVLGRLDRDQLQVLRGHVRSALADTYLSASAVDRLDDLDDLAELAHAIDRRLGIQDPPPTRERRATLAAEAAGYRGA